LFDQRYQGHQQWQGEAGSGDRQVGPPGSREAGGLDAEEPEDCGGAADQAAYRILQEALTNAAHHGAGSARIELAFANEAVELTVTNPVLTDGAARRGGGHGLIGMRERATLLGGSLDAERANSAFRVRARIPYGGHRA